MPFSVALGLMLVTMVCWGSWTNASRLARGWRLELFHADYSLGIFVVAVAAASAAGFVGSVRAAEGGAVASAALGGMALNLGSYLLMAGIARVGMTVAFPVSVGLALVVSTLLSYLVQPRGDAGLLAGGVALVFAAVAANSLAYRLAFASGGKKAEGGLGTCVASGLLFSVSGPFVARALTAARPVSVYAAAALFASGSLAASVALLAFLARRGEFSAAEYKTGSARNHLAGLAGGGIWGVGMILNFVAAGAVGMAVAGAVGQANPLVAAVWGIFVWREFQGAPRRAWGVLCLTMALYVAGLALLARSFSG